MLEEALEREEGDAPARDRAGEELGVTGFACETIARGDTTDYNGNPANDALWDEALAPTVIGA